MSKLISDKDLFRFEWPQSVSVEIKNQVALMDKSSLPILESRRWHISDTGYLVWRGRIDGKMPKKTIRFHRLVIGAKEGEIVDHINRNTLDNRRANLRIVTHQENMQNTDRKMYYYNSKRKRWCIHSRMFSINSLAVDSEEAAIRYVSALKAGESPIREFTDRRKFR